MLNLNGNISKRAQILTLFCVTLIVHLSVSLWVRPLYLSGDELGVVAETAYLIGEDWSKVVWHIGYYGYGQALLYVPVFAITQNPIYRYVICGCINSVMLSLIPVFAYHILGCLTFLSKKKCFAYALMIGMFPSHLVYTKWVWNEPLLCVLPWVLLLLIIRLVNNEGSIKVNSTLLAFFSVYCYATHGRGLVFIIAVILSILCMFIVCKRIIVSLPFFIVPLIICFIGEKQIKNFFILNLWQRQLHPEKAISNTLDGVIQNAIDNFSMEYAVGIIENFCAHTISAVLSTYGILLICLLFLVIVTFSRPSRNTYLGRVSERDKQNLAAICIFCCLCFFGALGAEVLAMGGEVREDFIIYTRYYANTLGLVFLLGLLIINETQFVRDKFKVIILVFALMLPLYISTASAFSLSPRKRPFVFFNLYPYMGKLENTELFSVCACVLVIFLMIMLIATSNFKKYNICFLLVIFLSAYYYCGIEYIIPRSKGYFDTAKNAYRVTSQIERFDEYCDDVYFFNPDRQYTFSAIQFMLPKYEVKNLWGVTANQVKDVIVENGGRGILIAYQDLQLEYTDKDFYKIVLDEDDIGSSARYFWVYGAEGSQYVEEHSHFQTSNSYGKPQAISLESFKTMGTAAADKITSSGEAGFVLFGPYMPLESESYTLIVEGTLISGEMDNSSFFDVVYDGGKEQLFKVENLQQFVDDNTFRLEANFTAEQDLEGCEFRAYINDGVILEIDSVLLGLEKYSD